MNYRATMAVSALASVFAVSTYAVANETRFFISPEYTCDGDTFLRQFRITEQSDGITLDNYNDVLVGYGNASLESFELSNTDIAKNPVIIERGNYRSALQISDLKNWQQSDSIELSLLASDGEKVAECESVTMQAVAESPSERFSAQVAHLQQEPMTLDVLPVVISADYQLPPIEWLPKLEQQGTKDKRKTAWKAFWPLYDEAIDHIIADPNVTPEQAKKAYSELEKAFALSHTHSWNDEILSQLDNIITSWARYHWQDDQQARLFQVENAEQLCRTIETINVYDWSEQQRLTTGVPIELWTKDFANQVLEWAESCEGEIGESTVSSIMKRWPEVEKQAEAYQSLLATIDDWMEMPVTIDNFQERNWLTFTYNQRSESGLHHDVFEQMERIVTKPYRESKVLELENDLKERLSDNSIPFNDFGRYCYNNLHFGNGQYNSDFAKNLQEVCANEVEKAYQARLAIAAEELIAQGKQAFSDGEIALSDMSNFCHDQAAVLAPMHYNVIDNISEPCEEELAVFTVENGKQIIDEAVAVIEHTPPTLAALEQGQTFTRDDIYVYLKSSMSRAFINAKEALNQYSEKANDKVDKVFKQADSEIKNELVQFKQSSINEANSVADIEATLKVIENKCQVISAKDFPTASSACISLQREMYGEIRQMQCEDVWQKTDFPDEFRGKSIDLGKNNHLSLMSYLCDSNVYGEKDSGIFSSDYLLVSKNEAYGDGPAIIVTALIDAPKDSDLVNLKKLKIKGAKLDKEGFDGSTRAILACLERPYLCIKENE